MARRWNLLSVPIDSVGRPGGTELAPVALLDAGLAEAVELGERDATMTLLRDPERDPDTGLVSSTAVLELTAEIRSKTAGLAAGGDPLLVLGGCCTLVPGVLGGLADAGRAQRIAYVDGHLDLYDGVSSETGEAADMPVAVALGRGPAGWLEAAGGHVLDPADLALLGYRDLDEARGLGSILPDELGAGTYIDTPGLRDVGPGAVGADVAASLGAGGDGYWVHLDVDVLDESVLPATDAFVPDGLDWDELEALLAPLVADPACLGLNVVCLNPEKDEGGRSTERVVALLAATIG
ncbi:MAG TPA: arginase family protein [Solirubrobacterales bacterium]|nr:arginase family protein [Solirubrobacterales bacterium]